MGACGLLGGCTRGCLRDAAVHSCRACGAGSKADESCAGVHTYTYVCTRACMHTHTHLYAHMLAHMLAPEQIGTRTHTHKRTSAHVCTWPPCAGCIDAAGRPRTCRPDRRAAGVLPSAARGACAARGAGVCPQAPNLPLLGDAALQGSSKVRGMAVASPYPVPCCIAGHAAQGLFAALEAGLRGIWLWPPSALCPTVH